MRYAWRFKVPAAPISVCLSVCIDLARDHVPLSIITHRFINRASDPSSTVLTPADNEKVSAQTRARRRRVARYVTFRPVDGDAADANGKSCADFTIMQTASRENRSEIDRLDFVFYQAKCSRSGCTQLDRLNRPLTDALCNTGISLLFLPQDLPHRFLRFLSSIQFSATFFGSLC